jgi:hypothetical protein
MLQTYEGGCHCGQVRFRVQGDLVNVSECNCSICTMKGFLHLVVPREQFELLSGQDAIATYLFGTGTAKHTFCRHCGIHSFYTPRSKPDGYSVNVRCLEGVEVEAVRPRPFDGRHWEEAMKARQKPGEP